MIYQTFIDKLRVELKDFGKIHDELFDGDGSTLNFNLNNAPIEDNSYTVKVGGVIQSNYVIDKDMGVVSFAVAPANGSDNIEISYKSVNIRDEDYVEIINDAIDHWRWRFWKEAIDTSSITTVKDQYEYDLSPLTNIIYLIQVWTKTSGTSEWNAIRSFTNWKWLGEEKKLFVDPPFSSSSLLLKFIYLKSLTKGSLGSDTLDIPDEWQQAFKYYIKARFYEMLLPEKIHETAAVSTIPNFAPAQLVWQLVERYDKKAEEMANNLAPKMPPQLIPILQGGKTF